MGSEWVMGRLDLIAGVKTGSLFPLPPSPAGTMMGNSLVTKKARVSIGSRSETLRHHSKPSLACIPSPFISPLSRRYDAFRREKQKAKSPIAKSSGRFDCYFTHCLTAAVFPFCIVQSIGKYHMYYCNLPCHNHEIRGRIHQSFGWSMWIPP